MEFKIYFETYTTFKYKIVRLFWIYCCEFIFWSNVSDTIWQVQAYKLLLYICIDFVALVSSYQFSFDFLVSLVSLIVSLTVFVTFSSYSIQSAEDCKSRFSNCKKYVLAQRYHILSFVLFLFWREKNQKSIFLRAIITFVYLTTEQYPITITLKYLIQL